MSDHEHRFVVRMRKIRQMRSMSQQQLADASGLGRMVVTKLENERREAITIAEVFAICDALGVAVPEMLSTEPMKLRLDAAVD